MKAILYIGHGTRSKEGAREAVQFLERVIEQVNVPIQEISFLELSEPSISDGFNRCIQQGATNILIVPLFLFAAGHIKKDIPEVLHPLLEEYLDVQISLTDPFGVQESILDAMAEMVMESVPDLSYQDSILIVGRGSSDSIIHQNFASITKGIAKRLKAKDIQVCYLAAAKPSFQTGIERVSKERKGRIIVIPYLLFAGQLLSEVKREVHIRQKQGEKITLVNTLSHHQTIMDLVVKTCSKKIRRKHAATYY